MKIIFRIENVQDATGSVRASHTFTQRGGVLGSGDNVDWRVQDLGRSIAEAAAQIGVMDGGFYITGLQNADIFVNESRSPIEPGLRVRLRDRDRIVIGGLGFRVSAAQDDALEPFIEGASGRTVESLVRLEAKADDALLREEPGAPPALRALEDQRGGAARPADPLAGFGRQAGRAGGDPMAAFEPLEGEGEGAAAGIRGRSPLTDGTGASAARSGFDRFGFEDERGGPSAGGAARKGEATVDHIALRPLAQALGLPIGDIDAEESRRLLGDVGRSLRVVAEELKRIYAAEEAQGRRLPLAAAHLHPLEDNPLRFSLSAETALEKLLLDQSPVHLSAPAAFQESMSHLRHHRRAVEEAIDAGLGAIMRALAPEALARRFAGYARSMPPEAERDAWMWRMYGHYFDELRSRRQRGLQMLFWEVFGHEYHKSMRALSWSDGASEASAEERP